MGTFIILAAAVILVFRLVIALRDDDWPGGGHPAARVLSFQNMPHERVYQRMHQLFVNPSLT